MKCKNNKNSKLSAIDLTYTHNGKLKHSFFDRIYGI